MQQKLEENLAKLVSIPSVTANSTACRDILDHVKKEIDGLGMFIHTETNTANPWLVATTQDTKTPDILLAAHIDVVPAPDEMFKMRTDDGKLYGRGVYDMKLAASCYIELLKAHANDLKNVNIGVLFTTDEETSGACMTDILEWGLRPNVVFLPDGGDDWAIEKRAKGLYIFELTAHGKAAHGSRPWEGENALHSILDVAQTLRSHYLSAEPDDPTLSLNKISSGNAANQIPDTAIIAGDFRTFNKQDLDDCKLLVEQLATTNNMDLRVINDNDPLIFDAENNPNVQSFIKSLQQVTGAVRYCDSYGASDARYFAQYDIPCIIVEPHGGGRHSQNEWILASDLEKYYQMIERWLFKS